MWAMTSRYLKAQIDLLTNWGLGLAIAGAVLTTVAEQFFPSNVGTPTLIQRVPGAIGALAVAIAAFLVSKATERTRVQGWTKARSTAESLKSLVTLYRASVPPFDGADRGKQLLDRSAKAVVGLETITPRSPDGKQCPATPLTVDSYITERIQEQEKWYNDCADAHQKSADQCRVALFVLGLVGAILAVAVWAASLSAWAALVATITAAITAHLKNQQHEMLAATYRRTAAQLGSITSEWAASGKTENDKTERNAFIARCESTMATENGAWAGLWTT